MRKILVVDDEIHAVRFLKRYLESKAYDVYTAFNGSEAIQKVKEVEPCIVLLDIVMEGMDGIEVLKEIKKINPKISVIMVTAVIDEKMAGTSLQSGADDYIVKPIDLNSLQKRLLVNVHQHLKKSLGSGNFEVKWRNQAGDSPLKKVLLIDDEEDFCLFLKRGLEMKRSFEVMTTNHGDEGIFLAKTLKPDIILLDIMMPGMTGGEVAEELLLDQDTCSIPIIFVTALIREDEFKQRDGVIGGRAFMAKPIMLEELIKKINSMSGIRPIIPGNN